MGILVRKRPFDAVVAIGIYLIIVLTVLTSIFVYVIVSDAHFVASPIIEKWTFIAIYSFGVVNLVPVLVYFFLRKMKVLSSND